MSADDRPEEDYPMAGVGSCVVLYGRTLAQSEPHIALIERGERFKGHSEGVGIPGGYVDLETGKEQPKDAAIREIEEELVRPEEKSVLFDLSPNRLQLVETGVNYKQGIPGTQKAGCAWNGYALALSHEEANLVRRHAQHMNNDSGYRDMVHKLTGEEIGNVYFEPVSMVLDKIESGQYSFAYAHEEMLVRIVAQGLLIRFQKFDELSV